MEGWKRQNWKRVGLEQRREEHGGTGAEEGGARRNWSRGGLDGGTTRDKLRRRNNGCATEEGRETSTDEAQWGRRLRADATMAVTRRWLDGAERQKRRFCFAEEMRVEGNAEKVRLSNEEENRTAAVLAAVVEKVGFQGFPFFDLFQSFLYGKEALN